MSTIIDIELALMYASIVAAVACIAWAAVKSLRTGRGANESQGNLIPARTIAWATAALLLTSLLLSFACGSGVPMLINGAEYVERFWLKSADMLINTSLILLTAAAAGIVFSLSGYCRRHPRKFASRRN